MISLIVATAPNFGIGKDNKLLWDMGDVPHDMNRFKKLTKGKIVIMGRKTYESIGHPLKGRSNMVLTKDPDFNADDCYIYDSFSHLEQELWEYLDPEEEVFVIGGAEIYSLFFPIADRIYHTIVIGDFEADAFFPRYEWGKDADWKPVHMEGFARDEKNKYSQHFYIFDRRIK